WNCGIQCCWHVAADVERWRSGGITRPTPVHHNSQTRSVSGAIARRRFKEHAAPRFTTKERLVAPGQSIGARGQNNDLLFLRLAVPLGFHLKSRLPGEWQSF